MGTCTGRWQYAVVWTPGPTASEYLWVAQSRYGDRHVWDSVALGGQLDVPTPQLVLTRLHEATLEFLERSTHRG